MSKHIEWLDANSTNVFVVPVPDDNDERIALELSTDDGAAITGTYLEVTALLHRAIYMVDRYWPGGPES